MCSLYEQENSNNEMMAKIVLVIWNELAQAGGMTFHSLQPYQAGHMV